MDEHTKGRFEAVERRVTILEGILIQLMDEAEVNSIAFAARLKEFAKRQEDAQHRADILAFAKRLEDRRR